VSGGKKAGKMAKKRIGMCASFLGKVAHRGLLHRRGKTTDTREAKNRSVQIPCAARELSRNWWIDGAVNNKRSQDGTAVAADNCNVSHAFYTSSSVI